MLWLHPGGQACSLGGDSQGKAGVVPCESEPVTRAWSRGISESAVLGGWEDGRQAKVDVRLELD